MDIDHISTRVSPFKNYLLQFLLQVHFFTNSEVLGFYFRNSLAMLLYKKMLSLKLMLIINRFWNSPEFLRNKIFFGTAASKEIIRIFSLESISEIFSWTQCEIGRVFHKHPAIQEWQHCQLCFHNAIKNQFIQSNLYPRIINLIYPLIYNFTFTNINWSKWRRKLLIYGNIKLAIMPTLPTLCICEKLE